MTAAFDKYIEKCQECAKLRAEVERLTRERDEWKSKWMALAQASLIAGTMKL
jgi:hypothetical protein